MRAAKIAVLAVALAFVVPSALGVSSPVAVAADDPVQEATDLADEAEKYFRLSGDTDSKPSERKKNRKEAYVRLKKARKLLDDHLDANPGETEDLDPLYVRIASMMYWVKKEAAIGELDGTGPVVKDDPRPKKSSGPTAHPRTPDGGKKKPPGAGGDEPGPDDGAVTEPEPETPQGPTPAEDLALVKEYEQSHPGDVPGLHERYTEFLSTHPDPATPEYQQAVERLEVLGRQLKDVYRTIRDDDPDALEDVDDAQVGKLVNQLVSDLGSDEEEVQVRAARYLGGLGSSLAVPALIDVLRSDEGRGELHETAADSLARIGGRRVCQRLVKLRADAALEETVAGVLMKIVARGGAEGRIAGESLAEYVAERDPELRGTAVETLHEAGKAGALGLAMLLEHADTERKAEYIDHLGEMGEPRAAGHLAQFLVVNARGSRKDQAKAARRSIEKLGKPAVKYLIPALDDEDVAVWTAEMLKRITGHKPKNDKRKTWLRWYQRNRRKLEM